MMFTEKQFYRQPWIWAILIFITLGYVYGLSILDVLYSYKVIFYLLPLAIAIILFYIISLTTIINDKSISIQHFPSQKKPSIYEWKQIQRIELVKINAINATDLLGPRFASNPQKISLGSNIFLTLYFKSGIIIMLGTQKPDEMAQKLSIICKENDIPFENKLKK